MCVYMYIYIYICKYVYMIYICICMGFFTATWPREVEGIARDFLQVSANIPVRGWNVGVTGVPRS